MFSPSSFIGNIFQRSRDQPAQRQEQPPPRDRRPLSNTLERQWRRIRRQRRPHDEQEALTACDLGNNNTIDASPSAGIEIDHAFNNEFHNDSNRRQQQPHDEEHLTVCGNSSGSNIIDAFLSVRARNGYAPRNNSPGDRNNSDSMRMLVEMDREGRLEEFMLYLRDYLLEDSPELVLTQLELNRACIQYLIQQTEQIPEHHLQQPIDQAASPGHRQHRRPPIKKVILNSCQYNSDDGTANLLVRFLQSPVCANSLEWIRLESAYVGSLPAHIASTLLHGLPPLPRLKMVQLVDIDLRPLTVADKVQKLICHSQTCETIELRHCRLDPIILSRIAYPLRQDEDDKSTGVGKTCLRNLIIHACALDDDLFSTFCEALTTRNSTDDSHSELEPNALDTRTIRKMKIHKQQSDPVLQLRSGFRNLALPSNRLTYAAIPTLTKLLSSYEQLESLDLQRMSRLFSKPIHNLTFSIEHNNNNHNVTSVSWTNEAELFELAVQGFCVALQHHPFGLQRLNLTNCGVTDDIAHGLFRAMLKTTVNQGSNRISHNGDSSGFVLQELWLGGNELSRTGEWVSLLPHLFGLRRLDLPKLPLESEPSQQPSHADAWYYHSTDSSSLSASNSTTVATEVANDAAGEDHQPNSDTKSSGYSLFWLCLERNTSLQHLSHDGLQSQPAQSILKRNRLLQLSQEALLSNADVGVPWQLLPQLLKRCNDTEGSTARHFILQEMCTRQFWFQAKPSREAS